jgi:hypothetical protein
MARQAELDELRKEIAALRAERPLSDLDRPVEHGIAPANSPDPKLDDPEVMAEGTGEMDANRMDANEVDSGAENSPVSPADDDPVDSDPAPVVRP